MSEQEVWTAALARELSIDPAVVLELSGPVLDMVRDVAHGVSRPAEPLTAFLVGLASASSSDQGGAPTQVGERVHERLRQVDALVRSWTEAPAN